MCLCRRERTRATPLCIFYELYSLFFLVQGMGCLWGRDLSGKLQLLSFYDLYLRAALNIFILRCSPFYKFSPCKILLEVKLLFFTWTSILVSLDNQGTWNMRSAIWERQYLGQQFYVRVFNPIRSLANEYDIPSNVLLCGKAAGRQP